MLRVDLGKPPLTHAWWDGGENWKGKSEKKSWVEIRTAE